MIEGFRVKNYRVLRDVTIGRLWQQRNAEPLRRLTAVIGKNGCGKSTLFDAFGFLSDCLATDVEQACDLKQRGGFDRLVSQGSSGPIEFEIYFRPGPNWRPLTYELAIDRDAKGRPIIEHERLRQRRKGQSTGWPFSFLNLKRGEGEAWAGTSSGAEEQAGKISVRLRNPRELAVSTYGALQEHPRIGAFRDFLQGWYLSYFAPDAARGLPLAGPQRHLNIHGDNLANVVQFMEREHPLLFQSILDTIAGKIPGIQKISTKRSDDGRLLLQFNDQGFVDPFFAQQMSDGTLKVFAYLLLLADPEPPSFIGIEEPENGLYHRLLAALVQEFRSQERSQIFLTTHQPSLVDELDPEETWILDKGENGFSTIRKASDDALVRNLVAEGLPLGGLWFSDYLDRS
jgi:predicted ATPase